MSYFSMHNHTYYSYLDGYASPKEYFESCKRNGLSGFCITDHGNNCSWVYFDELKKQYPEIKMCYGCEMYECEDINIKDSHSKYWHLLVIARTEEGRKALDWLITESQKGFYYKPRVDLNTFRECFKHFNSDSLIISSACLQSKLSRTEDYNKCLDYVKEYKEIFPHFYLEMQSHRFQEQAEYNKKILKLSQDTDTPFVITTDSHYANESDECFQNLWTQVGKKTVSGVDELRVSECYEGCFVQNEAQIHYTMDGQVGYDNVCKGLEETNLILNMIDKIDMPWQQPALPDYPLPEGYTSLHDYMTALINKGFVERGIMQKPKEELNIYIQRARYEMSVIEKMGFDGYFLIVREAINWCKENAVATGAGRGSAAGSLVCYCIGITQIDPIKYNLIFERFLNPERVGLPDIDTDVEDRDALIKHLQERYGTEYVGQVANFSYETPTVAVRDACKLFEIPFVESQKMSNQFIWDKWSECEENLPDLFKSQDSKIRKMLDLASHICNRVRQFSIHAGGVVIGKERLFNYCGTSVGKSGENVVNLDKHYCEPMGLIKFDFLGLANLTLLKNAKKEAGLSDWELDINNPDFVNDSATFDLIDSCNTEAVFQLESAGMKDLIRQIQPRTLKELSDINALFRPDAKAFIPMYIEGKKDSSKVTYWCSDVKPILEPTHGAMIYQEQMMDIVRKLGGRTYGGSDKFRKGVSKKDIVLVKQEADKLRDEIVAHGYGMKLAEEVSSYMASMGSYLFNKSHAIAYSSLSMQTAYLKAHYPTVFFECLLNMPTNDTTDISKYIVDANRFKVKVVQPSVNYSQVRFSIHDNSVLFGFSSISGIGENVAQQIVDERNNNGLFKSVSDFLERCSGYLNTSQIVALIKSGAFGLGGKKIVLEKYRDSMIVPREYKPVKSVTGTIKQIYDKYGLNFSLIHDKEARLMLLNEKKEEEFNKQEKERQEKERQEFNEKYLQDEFLWEFNTLSMFLTNNPMKGMCNDRIPAWESVPEGSNGVIAGVITGITKKKTKQDKRQYAFIQVYSSYDHLMECACWANQYAEYKDYIKTGNVVILLCQKRDNSIAISKIKDYNEWEREGKKNGQLDG